MVLVMVMVLVLGGVDRVLVELVDNWTSEVFVGRVLEWEFDGILVWCGAVWRDSILILCALLAIVE